MDLPILKTAEKPSTQTLIRYFHQAETNWTAHLAESEELEFGTAWTNPQFKADVGANCMLDVALPEGMSPDQAQTACEAHFAQRGAKCLKWAMNPSAEASRIEPMIAHLLGSGFRRGEIEILYLQRMASAFRAAASEGLTIIPARASFRHARELYEIDSRGNPELTDAAMLHLDDPHYDALLALRAGQVIAHIGVLAVGEIGLVKQLFVMESARRQGVGSVMLARAMEICARSLFKHVFVGIAPSNDVAIRLFQSAGFGAIGRCVEYQTG